MQAVNDNSDTITIDFILRQNKQKVLIRILLQYGQIDLRGLAEILGVSQSKLENVLMGRSYFNKSEVEELIFLFCACCGG